MASTTPVPEPYASLGFKDITIDYISLSASSDTSVVILTLNRPQAYNAATKRLLSEMESAYDVFERDDRVKAIVITGEGKAFCAGADLQVGFSQLLASKKNKETMQQFRDQGGRVALAIARSVKPTIVAINGPAAGFGLTITLPAAIRVAWKDAKIAAPFAQRGLTMESCSAFYLPRLIGLSNATYMTTTGSTFVASDPVVQSLFAELLPTPAETVASAIKIAKGVAANTSLVSTKLMRDMMIYGPLTPEETHVLDSRVFISVVGSKDNVEGIKSFKERSKPQFSGKLDIEEYPFWPWWQPGSPSPKPDSKL